MYLHQYIDEEIIPFFTIRVFQGGQFITLQGNIHIFGRKVGHAPRQGITKNPDATQTAHFQ